MKAWWSTHRITIANCFAGVALVALPLLVVTHLPTVPSVAALVAFLAGGIISTHVPS